MNHDLDEDDVRALRQDGDLGTYLRTLIRKPTTNTPARAGPNPHATHRPGAWPHGTHPTNSAICRPNCPCNPRHQPDTA